MRRPLPGRCFPAWLAIAGASALVLAEPVVLADAERVIARAEIGAEYDDNVHRAERIPGMADPAPLVASPLARGVFGLSAADSLGHGQDVAFSVLAAGKLFLASDARNENVLVIDNSGSWRIATDARGRLGIGATFYDATQSGTGTERALSGEARDFRSIVPTARLLRVLGTSSTLALAAGYRWFVYKPLHTYDFGAPVAAVEYRMTHETEDGEADWEVTASAGVELRRFSGPRAVAGPGSCGDAPCPSGYVPVMFDPTGVHHQDQFVTGQIDVMRTGRVLVGAGYAIQWNHSNSLLESLLRHVGTIRLTAPLPLGFYLATRAELVYVTYPDKITLAAGPSGQPNASFEDESRSQIRAELSRNVADHLQLVARYSYYRNALGSNAGDYHRQTATLSLAFTTD